MHKAIWNRHADGHDWWETVHELYVKMRTVRPQSKTRAVSTTIEERRLERSYGNRKRPVAIRKARSNKKQAYISHPHL